MNITIALFLGLIISLLGVVPPGLINMAAVKISLKEGRLRAVLFAVGASLVVIIQTAIAVVFSRYLSKHPDVVVVLQRTALAIFVLLTIYYLVFANKTIKPTKEIKVRSKKSRFFHGMLLSGINIFPIPYHAYMSLTLAGFGWLTFEKPLLTAYTIGSGLGTFITLYFYVLFFKKTKENTLKSQKRMNYIIGIVTGIISIITLINILNKN